MGNYMIGNKACDLNFTVTVHILDKSGERCLPSNIFAGLRFRLFPKDQSWRRKFRIPTIARSISIAIIHV